jgi:hypothetical protein
MELPDGVRVRKFDPVVELHFWNDHPTDRSRM